MHTDDNLYHAIIAAHHDRDPKAARRLAFRFPEQDSRQASAQTTLSGLRSPARLGIVNPRAHDVTALISRPFAALTSLAGAIVRPLPFPRVRSATPRCAANCG